MLNPKSAELPNDSSSPSCRSSANLGTCAVAFPRKRLGISPSSHEIMQPCIWIYDIYVYPTSEFPKKPLQYLLTLELWMHADVDAMFVRLVAWHTDTIRSRLPQLSCSWAQLDQGSSKAFVEICYVTRDVPYPSQRSCLATIQSLSSLLPVTAMKTCREMLPFATSASWRSHIDFWYLQIFFKFLCIAWFLSYNISMQVPISLNVL